ncbi:hypothetical protein DYL59_15890 [Pseudomonas kairouanensis]|uniref:Uncharacterized protein n=2 Tax=Pseudomonas kairouanensis TaxID=2293832 RepID=A0A4Z0APJ8_9PSED|nr:hypothetical protein DYL59_15890 [Pseudomonas kairouanensis]
MIQWSVLRALIAGNDVDVPERALSRIDEGVYKISETQYCLADVHIESGQKRLVVVSCVWAVSAAAFRRAYSFDIEADDFAIGAPPVELLPNGAAPTYGQIKRALAAVGRVMEHASYRVMSDGAFIHRSLENADATYHFRSRDDVGDELPYAIVWKCRAGFLSAQK